MEPDGRAGSLHPWRATEAQRRSGGRRGHQRQCTYPYRHWGILEMADQHIGAQDALEEQIGVRRVARACRDRGHGRPAPGFRRGPPCGHRPQCTGMSGLVPWGIRGELPGRGAPAPPGSSTPKAISIAAGHCWRDEATRERSSPMRHRMPPAERLEGRWLYGGDVPAGVSGFFFRKRQAVSWPQIVRATWTASCFFPKPAAQRAASFPPPAAVPRRPRAGPSAGAGSAIRGRDRGTGPPRTGGRGGCLGGGPARLSRLGRGRIADIVAGDTATDRPADLFISRSAPTGTGSKTPWAQGELDRLMTDAGYTVVHPQHSESRRTGAQLPCRPPDRGAGRRGPLCLPRCPAIGGGPDTRRLRHRRGPSGGALRTIWSGSGVFSRAGGRPYRRDQGVHHPAGRRIVCTRDPGGAGFRADRPDAGHHPGFIPTAPRLGREFRGHHRCRVRP